MKTGFAQVIQFLLCFSNDQLQSGWRRSEYTEILCQYFSGTTQQKIYALLLDDVQESQLPEFGENTRYVRYSGKRRYKKFLNALKKQRQAKVEPQQAAPQPSTDSSHQKYQITSEDINRIQNEYKKAQEYHQSDPATCLITARRIAEDICRQMLRTEISIPTQGLMLYKLIQQLTRNQVLPHTIAAPLLVIQNFGNVGAHPQDQRLTPDYAKPCMDSLGIVVRWYLERYHLPNAGDVETSVDLTFSDQATFEPQEQQIRHFLSSFIQKQYQQKNFEGNFDLNFEQKIINTMPQHDAMRQRPIRIFLSYTRVDEAQVKQLYHRLKDEGLMPWMDTEDLLPGQKFEYHIRQAIRESDFFLACLSCNSVNRRGVIQKEINEALDVLQEKLDEDIYLIPVRLEVCEVPERLRAFHWADLYDDNGFDKLLRAIQNQIENQNFDVPQAHEGQVKSINAETDPKE